MTNLYEPWRGKLAQKISDLNIGTFAFDADETLFKTQALFLAAFSEFHAFAYPLVQALDPEVQKRDIVEHFAKASEESYKIFTVDPDLRWPLALEIFAKNFKGEAKLTRQLQDSLPIFERIYHTSPEPYEGAIDTLNLLASLQLKTVLVTLAGVEWTEAKQKSLNDFPFDAVSCIDPKTNHTKRADDWKNPIEAVGGLIEESIVVGDSVRSDIRPAIATGVAYQAWIKNDHMVNKSDPFPPEGVLQIEGGITNFIPTLAVWNRTRN